MADRVYAAVHPMQPSGRLQPCDLTSAQVQPKQLPSSHRTVLIGRQSGDRRV